MKRIFLALVVLALAPVIKGGTVTLDGVAAYVNDTVVTVGEVNEAIAPSLPQWRQVYEGAELTAKIKEAFDEACDDLINAKLILKSYDADTKINKDGVDKYVEKKVSDFIQDRFGGDRQEFLKALRDEKLSMEEWRRRMRERVIVGMMRGREVESKVVISPREVREIYAANPVKFHQEEQLKLRVILIHGSTNTADLAVREASVSTALTQLKSGIDFADMAKKLSEDGKAQQGGDWGWVETKDLRPELTASLSKLATNTISGIIRMDGDFYLVKVEDRHPSGTLPFEVVRASIEKDLRRKEIRNLTSVWIARLRKDAYIKLVEPGP
ncbi:MAG: peptidyl-prolyl cis-trans isomerase [bacterium]|jgi:peptidyl-prolyl cis-trans isomerase SurA